MSMMAWDGAVGLSDSRYDTVGLSDLCRTLSDCRTVGLSDVSDCRILSDPGVGLSDRGSGRDEMLRAGVKEHELRVS